MEAARSLATQDESAPAAHPVRAAFRGVFRVAVLVVSIGLASSAARSANVSADAGVAPPPAATGSPTPSPTASPDFTLRDAGGFGAVARFVEMANGPTPTPQPSPSPEPTPVPPTAPTARAPLPVAEPTRTAPPAAAIEQPAPPPPPAPSGPWGLNTAPMDAYAQELFNDTNARRASAGLPALRVNGYLIGIARIRSQDMADHNYFAHISPITGDDAFSLMDKHGVPYGWAGENLAKNNYSDAQAVGVADEALWNSPHHRENILNPNYTDIGIALVIDAAGMKYFTIIFTGPA